MDIQLILAVILGIAAAVYVIRRILMQFSHTEKVAICDKCPVPDEKLKVKNEKR